ncbi:MAG: hypothetical protein Q9215_006887 [Flavoplaca cf. flavocitrina]
MSHVSLLPRPKDAAPPTAFSVGIWHHATVGASFDTAVARIGEVDIGGWASVVELVLEVRVNSQVVSGTSRPLTLDVGVYCVCSKIVSGIKRIACSQSILESVLEILACLPKALLVSLCCDMSKNVTSSVAKERFSLR